MSIVCIAGLWSKLLCCLCWLSPNRLAIYYLNAVSKGYQQANLDLKRKMQMVSISSSFFPPSVFLEISFVQDPIKQMTIYLVYCCAL